MSACAMPHRQGSPTRKGRTVDDLRVVDPTVEAARKPALQAVFRAAARFYCIWRSSFLFILTAGIPHSTHISAPAYRRHAPGRIMRQSVASKIEALSPNPRPPPPHHPPRRPPHRRGLFPGRPCTPSRTPGPNRLTRAHHWRCSRENTPRPALPLCSEHARGRSAHSRRNLQGIQQSVCTNFSSGHCHGSVGGSQSNFGKQPSQR